MMITPYLSAARFSRNALVTWYALIPGLRSYVATLGEGMRIRSSSGFGSSTPPLKKIVTCAYFRFRRGGAGGCRFCSAPPRGCCSRHVVQKPRERRYLYRKG